MRANLGIRQNKFIQFALVYALQSFIVLLVLVVGLDIIAHDIAVPMAFEGDALHHLMATRSIIDNGWWWHIPRMSVPFGLNMVAFPVNGNVDFALISFVALFSDKPGAVLNVYWFLTFVLSAGLCTWSLKLLEISTPVAFVTGILFAFIPHAFARNLGHLMLVSHFVPPVCSLAIIICSDRWDSIRNSSKFLLLLSCACVGASYVYAAFFSSYVLSIALLFHALQQRNFRPKLIYLLPIVTVFIFSVLNAIPSFLEWRQDADLMSQMTSVKSPAEAEIYGLKLRHLVTPIENHPLEFVRALVEKSHAINFPLENENNVERLGLFGAIGFITLLWVSIFGSRSKARPINANLKYCASLSLAVFLFATIGGVGAIFNSLISAEIRTYNRMAVFIAFFSLVAISVLLDQLHGKLRSRKYGMFMRTPVLVFVLVSGIMDQSDFSSLKLKWQASSVNWYEVSAFVQEARELIPSGANIFQLPHSPYPHTPQLNRMISHAHIKPSITSGAFGWSWPTFSSNSVKLSQFLSDLPPSDLIASLIRLKFNALWIDSFGYADNAELIVSNLSEVPGVTLVSSNSGRYFLATFEPLAQSYEVSFSQAEREKHYRHLLNPHSYNFGEEVRFGFGGAGDRYIADGWSQIESTGRWSTSKRAKLIFDVSPTDRDLVLKVKMHALTADQTVFLSINNKNQLRWENIGEGWFKRTVPYEDHENKGSLIVEILVTQLVKPIDIGLNTDARDLGIFLKQLTISEQRNNTATSR